MERPGTEIKLGEAGRGDEGVRVGEVECADVGVSTGVAGGDNVDVLIGDMGRLGIGLTIGTNDSLSKLEMSFVKSKLVNDLPL